MPAPVVFDPVLGRQFVKYTRLVAQALHDEAAE